MNQNIKLLWTISLFIKVILATSIPLSTDEAYYWVWSKLPQLSYYDHPPAVAWLFTLGSPLDNFFSGSRIPGVILGHLTLLVWYFILKPHFNNKQLHVFMWMGLLAPLLGPGSLIITPDIPVMFAWSLSILFFLKSLETEKLSWFLALGASLGIGFCSKYHIVLFTPIAVAYLVFTRQWKHKYFPLIGLSVISFIVFSLPVFLWNYQNDFISFKFQLDHGLGGKEWQPKWTVTYLLGQFFLVFPTIFYLVFKCKKPELKYLYYFGFGPLIFFLFTSFKGHVEANWPIIAFPSLIALAAYSTQFKKTVLWTMGIWTTAFLIVLSDVFFQWIPIDEKRLKTRELTKFEVLVPFVEKYQPFYARSYQMAGKLSFESKILVPKLPGYGRKDIFDYRKEAQPVVDVIFVGVEKNEYYPKKFHNTFKLVERIPIDSFYDIIKLERQ